jgi:hypothetical protein
MEFLKIQKPNAEIVQAIDVELSEEQLDVISGGVDDDDARAPRNTVVKPLPLIVVTEVK